MKCHSQQESFEKASTSVQTCRSVWRQSEQEDTASVSHFFKEDYVIPYLFHERLNHSHVYYGLTIQGLMEIAIWTSTISKSQPRQMQVKNILKSCTNLCQTINIVIIWCNSLISKKSISMNNWMGPNVVHLFRWQLLNTLWVYWGSSSPSYLIIKLLYLRVTWPCCSGWIVLERSVPGSDQEVCS